MKNIRISIYSVILAGLLCVGCSRSLENASVGGGFKSPEEAGQALLTAAREQDAKALDHLFGEGFVDYVSSGDPVADQLGLEQLAKGMEQHLEIASRDDGARILIIGKRSAPFPVPLIKKERRWIFDSTEGAEEIISRRIGDNEIRAIKVAEFYTEAQKLYFSKDRDGDAVLQYAKKFLSSPSKKDGLYWDPSNKQLDPSPFGPLVGIALDMGYRIDTAQAGDPVLRGYHYRILPSQGAHAAGGAKSYVDSKGRMTKGFALIAYPATWDNSGIMTFIVGPDGKVLQKDLGPETVALASKITSYDPDKSWEPVRN